MVHMQISQFKFSSRSFASLLGVRPELVVIAHRALQLSAVDFGVTEGLRTIERQKLLVAEGKSKTLNSRHLTGHALDVAAYVNGKLTWNYAEYETIAVAFKAAAAELGIPLEWGGDWKSFKDGPHYQLPFKDFP